MSGDPKECREHAMNCMSLAKEASDAQAKQMLLDLVQAWTRLAAELEDELPLLKVLNEMEFKSAPDAASFDEEDRPEKAA